MYMFNIRTVHIQSVDMFGPKVGFIKLKADVVDAEGRPLPGIVFMRGGSVAILPVFICDGEEFAVLTVQPRFAIGKFDFVEIPAGMLDGSGDFAGVAAKELHEELGLSINSEELIDLSAFVGNPHGFYPSPGGCDEVIRIFALERNVTRLELDKMTGRCTGILSEGEQITLAIAPLNNLCMSTDAKAIIAYALYKKFRQQTI